MACRAWFGPGMALALVLAAACTSGADLPTDAGGGEVPNLSLEVLGQHAIRLRWSAAPSLTLRLERRVNLEGQFTQLTGDLTRSQSTWLDDELVPDTFYGYRLVAFDQFGHSIGNSTVVGGRTPPPPGITVAVSTEPAIAPAVDPDGYDLTIAGMSDTVRTPADVTSTLAFSPLAPGPYRVTLGGLAPQCSVADSLTRDVTVTDLGTATVQTVLFQIQCRNPERGRVTAVVNPTGELPDTNGYDLQLAGLADDTGLPDSARAYFGTKHIGATGGDVAFEDLRPGSYTLSLENIAGNCTNTTPRELAFTVAALDDLRRTFAVNCEDANAASRPFLLRPTWLPSAALTGSPVALDYALDLTQRPSQDIVAFETQLRVPTEVLRYDSTTSGDVANVVANQPQAGLVLVSGFATGTGPKGVVRLARIWFTVTGPSGASVTTQTTHSNTVGLDGAIIDTLIRTLEGTFTVGSGGGGSGAANQPPQARANGPYTSTAGTPVAFSSAGSSDPDGTIGSFAWSFGDGGTGTGPSPTHSYAAAGSYTVTLTVTDDKGASASGTAQVSITAAGGGGGGPGSCGAGTAAQPFVLCSTWSPAVTAAGGQVLLTQTIDLTADGAQDLVAFESTVATDPTLIRFDSARAGQISNLVVNGSTPGTVRMGGFLTGSNGPKGFITITRVYYTVVASAGATTTVTSFSNFVGTNGTIIDGKIAATEGTLTIGGGGSTGASGSGSSGGGDTSGVTAALDWSGTFGALDGVSHLVPLSLTLDLRQDPSLSLGAWQVGSLTWDPTVLSYASTDFAGGSGRVDATHALEGRLALGGTPGVARSGLVTVAVVRFLPYGASGSSSSATVHLDTVSGSASGTAVDLVPRITVHDGRFVVP